MLMTDQDEITSGSAPSGSSHGSCGSSCSVLLFDQRWQVSRGSTKVFTFFFLLLISVTQHLHSSIGNAVRKGRRPSIRTAYSNIIIHYMRRSGTSKTYVLCRNIKSATTPFILCGHVTRQDETRPQQVIRNHSFVHSSIRTYIRP